MDLQHQCDQVGCRRPSQDITKKLDGGKIYEMTFQIVAYAGESSAF